MTCFGYYSDLTLPVDVVPLTWDDLCVPKPHAWSSQPVVSAWETTWIWFYSMICCGYYYMKSMVLLTLFGWLLPCFKSWKYYVNCRLQMVMFQKMLTRNFYKKWNLIIPFHNLMPLSNLPKTLSCQPNLLDFFNQIKIRTYISNSQNVLIWKLWIDLSYFFEHHVELFNFQIQHLHQLWVIHFSFLSNSLNGYFQYQKLLHPWKL